MCSLEDNIVESCGERVKVYCRELDEGEYDWLMNCWLVEWWKTWRKNEDVGSDEVTNWRSARGRLHWLLLLLGVAVGQVSGAGSPSTRLQNKPSWLWKRTIAAMERNLALCVTFRTGSLHCSIYVHLLDGQNMKRTTELRHYYYYYDFTTWWEDRVQYVNSNEMDRY